MGKGRTAYLIMAQFEKDGLVKEAFYSKAKAKQTIRRLKWDVGFKQLSADSRKVLQGRMPDRTFAVKTVTVHHSLKEALV